jgi:hypothetical protein
LYNLSRILKRKEVRKMSQKGHPCTSEPTYPHKGDLGKEHVELIHYGPDGKEIGRTTHITAPGLVELGRRKEEAQKKKG